MAFTVVPSAGAKLRASVLSALITELRPVSAVKTSDTSRNTTTSRTADPDLSVAVPANSTWDYELLIVATSAANAAGDISIEMQYPSGATHMYGAHGVVDTLASGASADLFAGTDSRDNTSPSAALSFGLSTTFTSILVSGRVEIGATPGNLLLAWAQSASNANNSTVKNGSRLVAHRVA